MKDFVFRSADQRYGLRIPQHLVEVIRRICLNSEGVETGGILVGFYTERLDCAVVTQVSGPPRDSVRGPRSFVRGVYGLHLWLNMLWKKERHYFLGDWHFHPGEKAEPSTQDIWQTEKIALSNETHCPEPILLLVGGDPKTDTEFGVFIYLPGQGLIGLLRTAE